MTSNSIKEKVLDMLKHFRENRLQISILRYEIEHPTYVTPDDMIETLTFGHSDILGSTPGHISNKTLYIAMNYQDRADKANAEAISEIAVRLTELEQEQERLLHYIGLLSEDEAAIVRMTYMEGMTNDQISAAFGLGKRTITRRRHEAIDHLCDMYAYMMALNQG